MAAVTPTFNNGLYTPFTTAAAAAATPAPFTLATPRFSIAAVTVENPKLASTDALAATSQLAATTAPAAVTTPVSVATSAPVSSKTAEPIADADASSTANSPNTLLPFFIIIGIIAGAVITCVLWRRRRRIRSAWTRVRRGGDDDEGEKDAVFDPEDWTADPARARTYAYRQGDDLECGADRYGTVSSSRFNLAAAPPIGRSQSAHFDEDEKDTDRGWEWGRDEALDQMLLESRARYSPDELADMAAARDGAPRARLARAGSAILSTISSFGRSGRGVRTQVPTDDRFDEHGIARDPDKALSPGASSYAATPHGLDVRYEAADGREVSMLADAASPPPVPAWAHLRMPEQAAAATSSITRTVRRWALSDSPAPSPPPTPSRPRPVERSSTPAPADLPPMLQAGPMSPSASGMASVDPHLTYSPVPSQPVVRRKPLPGVPMPPPETGPAEPLSLGNLAALMFPTEPEPPAPAPDPFTALPLASAVRRKATAAAAARAAARSGDDAGTGRASPVRRGAVTSTSSVRTPVQRDREADNARRQVDRIVREATTRRSASPSPASSPTKQNRSRSRSIHRKASTGSLTGLVEKLLEDDD